MHVQLADLFGLLALDHVGNSLAADVTAGQEERGLVSVHAGADPKKTEED